MNILMLCEGEAETWGSWSGTAKSLLHGLRAAGHSVRASDVDLHGIDRWTTAVLTFAADRRRWGVRYRLGGEPFRQRSRNAGRAIASAGAGVDLILQIGATFRPLGHLKTPYVLYCDSNIRMAEGGIATGFSPASRLRPAELSAIVERETTVYRDASAIFAISDCLRRSFIEDFKIPADRAWTVHAGPNFDSTRIPPLESLKRCSNGRPPTVLFVGAQFQRKGGDVLLKAFRRVRELIPDVRLVIVGPDQLEPNEPGVECLGYLSKDNPYEWQKLIAAYASADVFCLPTRFEPFGIAFLEAMYFGLPCVGTDVWAVPEIITDGVTGFTCRVDDADAVSERILRLLGERELACRMGAAGRARAESYFTWQAVVERMLQVINPLAHHRVGAF